MFSCQPLVPEVQLYFSSATQGTLMDAWKKWHHSWALGKGLSFLVGFASVDQRLQP